MTSAMPYSLPKQTKRGGPDREAVASPLEGEVLPPRMRVVHDTEERVAPPPEIQPSFRLRLSTALLATGVAAVLLGVSGFAAYRWQSTPSATANLPDPTVVALSRLQDDLGKLKASVDSARQDETVRALKKSVDVLKAEFDGLRNTNTAAMAQLNAKLDKPTHDAGPNLTDVVARIDKLDHDPKLADIAARLDRIEHQVSSSTPTGSISAPTHPPVAQTIVAQGNVAPIPLAKGPLRPAVLDNWIVRDVYSGVALVEGRAGGVREVVPGEFLPGAGEVRSIERRGRAWIVVTSRGIIDTETW